TGGTTVDDVQSVRKPLAAILGVPANGVRIAEDPDNAGAADMTLVRKNMLRELVKYEEPSRLGGSIMEPLRLGVYEDGQVVEFTQRAANGDIHMLVVGMTGSGKTTGAWAIFGEEFT